MIILEEHKMAVEIDDGVIMSYEVGLNSEILEATEGILRGCRELVAKDIAIALDIRTVEEYEVEIILDEDEDMNEDM